MALPEHMITIRQQSGSLNAYVAIPPKAGHFNGAVIVVHELWGLTEQIKRTADRFAAQGYYAIAPDLFTTDKANRMPSEQMQRELFSPDEHVRYKAMPAFRAMVAPTQTPQFTSLVISRLLACFEYAYNQPLVHQKVAVVGFGLGGDYVFDLAVRERRLRCAVAFYGHAPRVTAELRHIRCPILGLYGEKETSLMKEVDALSIRMAQAGCDFTVVQYQGVGHAFFNESNIFAYHQGAADSAWRRTLGFLNDHCGIVGMN